MKNQKRIRDYGIIVGQMKTGRLNAITDVPGIRVGHTTLSEGFVQTGVTAILPHSENTFEHKLTAACHVINGFGKTAGFIQIEEMGTIETPILLTNTLSVGTVSDALVEYMLSQDSRIGLTESTVNPVVCECNDGFLNDIRGRHVTKEHVFQAIASANTEFEEGAVGAGTGMSCYHLKGGIGTSSRILHIGRDYTVGALLLTNFGKLPDLTICGMPAGKRIEESQKDHEKEMGSVIIVLATDIPLSERQLKRFSKRASVGLARTGAQMGSGSGELVVAFTTANPVSVSDPSDFHNMTVMNERHIDELFRAAAETVEEAVLNSLICAPAVQGRDGNVRRSLANYMGMLYK